MTKWEVTDSRVDARYWQSYDTFFEGIQAIDKKIKEVQQRNQWQGWAVKSRGSRHEGQIQWFFEKGDGYPATDITFGLGSFVCDGEE